MKIKKVPFWKMTAPVCLKLLRVIGVNHLLHWFYSVIWRREEVQRATTKKKTANLYQPLLLDRKTARPVKQSQLGLEVLWSPCCVKLLRLWCLRCLSEAAGLAWWFLSKLDQICMLVCIFNHVWLFWTGLLLLSLQLKFPFLKFGVNKPSWGGTRGQITTCSICCLRRPSGGSIKKTCVWASSLNLFLLSLEFLNY